MRAGSLLRLRRSTHQSVGVRLDAITEVYRIEAQTKGMSAADRLHHHQQESGPVMRELKEWVDKQFADKTVEPHSSLGKALAYLQNHWEELTRVSDGCRMSHRQQSGRARPQASGVVAQERLVL